MAFQWLQMRITEETDRRKRETETLQRLPAALAELGEELANCVREYAKAFGAESAGIQVTAALVRLSIREERDGQWAERASVEITIVPAVPGFRVDCGGESLLIEVGLLPGSKHYYRDGDKYLTMEDLTKRILDRALFPKLVE